MFRVRIRVLHGTPAAKIRKRQQLSPLDGLLLYSRQAITLFFSSCLPCLPGMNAVRNCCATTAATILLAAACASFRSAPGSPEEADGAVADASTSAISINCYPARSPVQCDHGQTCCVVFAGPDPDHCVDADITPCDTTSPSGTLACDDPTDCAPNVCCLFEHPDRFEAHCVSPDQCAPPKRSMCLHPYDCDAGSSCDKITLNGVVTDYQACR
jgi:hypothetical protein